MSEKKRKKNKRKRESESSKERRRTERKTMHKGMGYEILFNIGRIVLRYLIFSCNEMRYLNKQLKEKKNHITQ